MTAKQTCVLCNKELVRTKHVGYYTSFQYWACGCEDLNSYVLEVGPYGQVNVEEVDWDKL